MSNELLLLLSAIIDLTIVFVASRLGSKWLFATIVINLLLISIFGVKLIEVFGLVTNAGNVFYAAVFFATQLLIEGKKDSEAVQTIPLGVIGVAFFTSMAFVASTFSSFTPQDTVTQAINMLFPLSLRVVIASSISYLFAQYFTISLYRRLYKRYAGKKLWLRSLVANVLGQLFDSCLFFTIAFATLPIHSLVQAILAGWVIKTAVSLLGTPYLYIEKKLAR